MDKYAASSFWKIRRKKVKFDDIKHFDGDDNHKEITMNARTLCNSSYAGTILQVILAALSLSPPTHQSTVWLCQQSRDALTSFQQKRILFQWDAIRTFHWNSSYILFRCYRNSLFHQPIQCEQCAEDFMQQRKKTHFILSQGNYPIAEDVPFNNEHNN